MGEIDGGIVGVARHKAIQARHRSETQAETSRGIEHRESIAAGRNLPLYSGCNRFPPDIRRRGGTRRSTFLPPAFPRRPGYPAFAGEYAPDDSTAADAHPAARRGLDHAADPAGHLVTRAVTSSRPAVQLSAVAPLRSAHSMSSFSSAQVISGLPI